jgi:antirestriction protein
MEEQQDHREEDESPREPRPRIYVASLSDYNAGRLHGAWIDADRDTEELEREIAAILERSPEPVAEEWAIHDYEGFGQAQLSEYESLERVGLIACGIAEHGEAFAAWAAICGNDEEALERFEDVYFGNWPSLADYAQDFLSDLGLDTLTEGLPEWIQPYLKLDVEGFARDLELGGDVTSVEAPDGSVWVFEGHG